jgi:hypothetical protein
MYSNRFPRLDCVECARRVRESGGFTVNPHSGEYPESGHAVAVDSEHELISRLDEHAKLIGIYADLYADDIPENGLIGGWVHEGSLYLDLSELHESEAVALALGRERGQIAIYRLDDGEEISC